jgi:hypothetical protein
MENYNFDGFALTEANNDQMVFTRGSSEILFETIRSDLNWIPMEEYNFKFTKNEKNDGVFKVSAFEKDKYGIVHIDFSRIFDKGDLCKCIVLSCHIDSFKKEDMVNFMRGTSYDITYEVVN